MWEIKQGDAIEALKTMPDQSINTRVTSPPYWGLRDYGVDGQLGLEPTPAEYVANLADYVIKVGEDHRGRAYAKERIDVRETV